MRILILGAGVTGLSTAYHFARQRVGHITVVDKGPVGDGSSGRAAGIITGHLWTETGVQVRKRCLQLYRELSRTLPGYSFHQCGCLNLFEPDSWNGRKTLLPMYERLGVPYELMNPDEIRRRWPAIHVPEDWIGLFDLLGGYSEPDEYIPALTSRVKEFGVNIRESQIVTGLRLESGRVTGVQTPGSSIEADVVISTVFAWTLPLLKEAGLIMPVKSFVHQRYVSQALSPPIPVPAVNANPSSVYFRPSRHGAILAGLETAEREEYAVDRLDFHLSEIRAKEDLRARLRANLSSLLPPVSDVGWVSDRMGLITFSMDGEPIVGPVQAIPGLFVALGFHSGGFAYNPGVGELLADYVTYGKPRTADIDSWSLNRFDSEEVRHYTERIIAQRDVARRRH